MVLVIVNEVRFLAIGPITIETFLNTETYIRWPS